MWAIRIGLLAAEASDKENLYPHAAELVVGAVAFAVIFFFMWKWVIPRVNTLLEERRQKIQGELERAEETRSEADHILEEYRTQLAGAREEAGRIIEEARKTAEQLRKDMLGRAEEESQGSSPARRTRSAPSATGSSRSSARRSVRSRSSSPPASWASPSTRPRTSG